MGSSPDNAMSKCKDCRFWQNLEHTNLAINVDMGECRLYPPTVQIKESYWPKTHENQWCGQWQAKEAS